MCGRYASYTSPTGIQLAFDLDSLGPECESLPPSWNVAPTQDIPIIVERMDPHGSKNRSDRPAPDGGINGHGNPAVAAEPHQPSGSGVETRDHSSNGTHAHGHAPGNTAIRDSGSAVRELHVARWGLVPPWSKDPSKGPQMINARIETLPEKRTFAPALAKRRCIVPADGYFEWQAKATGKIPHYIHSTNGELLAFAGLYGWWKKPDSTWLLTATIITRAAEGELAKIHDRTPVVLERFEFSSWLDPGQDDPYAALAVIDRPNRELHAEAVGKAVGNVRNNGPENIIPVTDQLPD